MDDQPRGLRKLFKFGRKGHAEQKSAASSDVKKHHSSPGPTADTKKAEAGSHNDRTVSSTISAIQGQPNLADQTLKSKVNAQPPVDVPPPSASAAKDVRPLWDRAYDRLRNEKQDVVDEYERILVKTAGVQNNLPLNETMKAVVNNRVAVITSRQWKIRIPFRKDKMLVTEILDKIVGVVLKFKEIGSTVASLDPVHAGIPFAAICFMLPILTNASEERQASLKGIELVADLVDLYSGVESIYLRQDESPLIKKFSKKLEDLYFEILDFLARAACSFDESTAKRLAKEIIKREDWAEKLDIIKAADEDCQKFSTAFHQQDQGAGIRTLTDLMHKQQESTQELLRKFNRQFNDNQQVISWVSSIDVDSAHGRVRAKLGSQYQNSGQWLRPRYSAWKESPDQPTFWICGSVGTGKSSLISHVIEWHLEDIQAKNAERSVYFYCSGKEGQRTDATAVLRSLIAQLAWSSDGSEVAHSVKTLHESGDGRVDKLDVELLVDLADRNQRTTVIIDALDECVDYSKLLSLLKKASDDMKTGTLKFFFSSRPNVTLLPTFPSWGKLELDAERELTSYDMEKYIHTQVTNPEGRRLLDGRVPELEEKLIKTLTFRAQGMFRWVELQLAKFLSDQSALTNSEDVEAALDKLMNEVGDPDLDKVYSEIYDMNTKAGTKSRAIATRAFHWMMCAQRPLSVPELAAVAAADQSETMKKEVNDKYILKICSNFIIADSSLIAQFAHLSVREYLQHREINGIKEYSSERSHNPVAETCLTCLLDLPLPLSSIEKFDDTPLGYSVLYWASHWQQAFENRGSSSLGKIYAEFIPGKRITALFTDWLEILPKASEHRPLNFTIKTKLRESKSPIQSACVWGFIEILGGPSKTPGTGFADFTKVEYQSGLETASTYGQEIIVEFLLGNGVPATVDALHAAVCHGHEKIVKSLLDNGVGIDEPDILDDKAIIHAAKAGNCGMMALLLREGADVSVTTSNNPYRFTSGTALHFAAQDGNLAMVQLLLDHGADVEATPFSPGGSYERSPLGCAISSCREDIAALLIQKIANVRGPTASQLALQCVLHRAAQDGKEEAALRVLRKGANPNTVSEQGRTALHEVCRFEHVGIAKFLIQQGADPRRADKSGRTPLHEAADGIRGLDGLQVVQLLLENGAEVEARDMNQRVPLHEAAGQGSAHIVGLLLEKGADIEACDNKSSTPLHEACKSWYTDVVQLLVEKGANINVKDSEGRTPLHLLAKEWKYEGIRLLLGQQGIDPNPKDKEDLTPLSVAMRVEDRSSSDGDEVVQLFLTHGGVSWEARGKNGFLWDMMRDGEERWAQKLIETGSINVDETGILLGETLLHHAVELGFEPSVRLLLERGASVNAQDVEGRTPLHRAVTHQGLEFTQLLLEKGAKIDVRDEEGCTPLIRAFEDQILEGSPDTEFFSIVDCLLENGADVNGPLNCQTTLLHIASGFRKEVLVRYLLERGADVSLKTDDGRTALHYAASGTGELLPTVTVLLEHGADKMARQNDGRTPLDSANSWSRKELEDILEMKYPGSVSGGEQ